MSNSSKASISSSSSSTTSTSSSASSLSLAKEKPKGFNGKYKQFSDTLLCHKNKVSNEDEKDVEKQEAPGRNLRNEISEHKWDAKKYASKFKESGINIENPLESKGLSASDAKKKLEENGKNELPKTKEMSDLELFLRQFLNLLWLLLLVADGLSFIGYLSDTSKMEHLWVSIIILVMIIGMCFVSFWQEREARKAVKGFESLLPEKCDVIRDGKEEEVNTVDLVVGDLVKIKSGSTVPADIRILQCEQLKIEASSITGESEPMDCTHEIPEKDDETAFDAHNIAFNGSMIVEGSGMGVVIRTGKETVIGKIATMTTGQEDNKSRLEKQMSKFVKFLVVVASSVAISVFVAGGFVHKWKNVVRLMADGFLVPCGLPATVTSVITVVARRLASRKVYLKRLDVVEALGSCNIIATDKTGTLTKNIMKVTDIWYSDETISEIPEKESEKPEAFQRIIEAMCICNSAKFEDEQENCNEKDRSENKKNSKQDHSKNKENKNDSNYHKNIIRNGAEKKSSKSKRKSSSVKIEMPSDETEPLRKRSAGGHFLHKFHRKGKKKQRDQIEEDDSRPAVGSPSEVAMLQYSDKLMDASEAREKADMLFEIPFSSRLKYHLVICRKAGKDGNDNDLEVIVKGAAEILIEKCSSILTKDGEKDLNEEERQKFNEMYEKFGQDGRRVIGFAYKKFNASPDTEFNADEENFPHDELVFSGMCAIMDPPKEETTEALQLCKTAGIKKDDDWEIIRGEEINDLAEKDWDRLIAKRALVFARTTPEQKLLIVEQCQKRKQIIAMTGDGVNDAPALKRADIGVAMGSGSSVAKEASDIILMNDNFASIVDGIREGRMMFDNIKKLLGYTQIHSFPEIWPIIINFCFGFPVGITPLQILAIDLGTEILPGMAMCKEPMEGGVMEREPRTRKKVLVSNTLLGYSYLYAGQIQSLGCFLSYCCIFWYHGINISDLWMSALECWQEGGKDFVSNGRTFSVDEQLYINRQACSAWQVGIVFGQFWHIYGVRTRRQSIFKHGVFRNMYSNFALIAELLMLAAMVYIPGLNTFLGGAPVPVQCWAVVAAFDIPETVLYDMLNGD
uniref:Cation-transporting P-type ATPase N-terminal domain-containing protein n=1 Tax=Panagrolaimus sp. ES5 TaxID=591445 RepID=A0AC34F4S3_9BILA